MKGKKGEGDIVLHVRAMGKKIFLKKDRLRGRDPVEGEKKDLSLQEGPFHKTERENKKEESSRRKKTEPWHKGRRRRRERREEMACRAMTLGGGEGRTARGRGKKRKVGFGPRGPNGEENSFRGGPKFAENQKAEDKTLMEKTAHPRGKKNQSW